jgi:hypothetical protein
MSSNSSTFVKITNKDIWCEIQSLQQKVDKVLENSKWARRIAYMAMAVAVFAVTVSVTCAMRLKY